MPRRIQIADRTIDEASAPYLIAEAGVNHEGSLDIARRQVELAKEGGAHAIKFQTYKASTLAAKDSPYYWDLASEPTRSQFELFSKYDNFGPDDYRALADHCRACGIDFLSTPFDDEAVDLLAELCPALKVASADVTNTPLLRRIAATGLPVILSTGAATVAETRQALATLEGSGAGDVALLHCILNYPCPAENGHLSMIEGLAREFPDHVIGYSDHTHPDAAMTALTSAYLKGARILEKHFTHDKTLPGNDHYHAADVEDLKVYGRQIALVRTLEGRTDKAPIESEALSRRNARRSIVTKGGLRAGETVTAERIIPKRPATGISPLEWDAVIGRKAARDLPDDHILQWDDLAPA